MPRASGVALALPSRETKRRCDMRTLLTWLTVLFVCGAALAQAPDSGENFLRALSEKADQLDVLWDAGNYEAAVGLLHEMKRDAMSARRHDLAAAISYTLACGYSLLNDASSALVQLSAAVDLGFSDFLLMRRDPDLDNVRKLPEFEWLVGQAKEVHRVDWNGAPGEPPTVFTDSPDCEELRRLRREQELEAIVAACDTDHERLVSIVSWAHSSFEHDGSNEPSAGDPLTILSEAAKGAKFRCVEYATLVVAAARALGMPARELCLATRDVEMRSAGAGHVVAEVWLRDLGKWAYADAQAGIVPALKGVPLNAVELREVIWSENPSLVCSGRPDGDCGGYESWVLPYLYYFLVRADQRFYSDSPEGAKDLMLTPAGARRPGVFQRASRLYDNTAFTSNPDVLYSPPAETGGEGGLNSGEFRSAGSGHGAGQAAGGPGRAPRDLRDDTGRRVWE
jgi:hypothetical protein